MTKLTSHKMAESNPTIATSSTDVKSNFTQRPTSLIVPSPSAPSVTIVPKGSDTLPKTSPQKHQSPSAIITIPPSPIQNKTTPTSPTSPLETSVISNAATQSNSLSFMEMASNFFRWGGKSGGNSAASNTNQTEKNEVTSSKVEASPKSATIDIEGGTEQPPKTNKSGADKTAQVQTVNVITNPNENIKLPAPVTINVTGSGMPAKHQKSRKTMRAPQPPISGTSAKGVKVEPRRTSQVPTQNSFQTDAAEVQKTEETLLKLLSDFNSGKVNNFWYQLTFLIVLNPNP